MEVVDRFIHWSSDKDRDSFMTMCEPFLNPPLDAQGFVKWVSAVVHSHAQGSADKQLLAVYLSVFLSELAPTYLAGGSDKQSVIPYRLFSDTSSSANIECVAGRIDNARLLH